MFRIRPSASWAIEPVWLVHAEQTASLSYDGHLITNGIRHRFQSPPPSCSAFVVVDACDIVFAHYALQARGDVWPTFQAIEFQSGGHEHRARTRSAQVK